MNRLDILEPINSDQKTLRSILKMKINNWDMGWIKMRINLLDGGRTAGQSSTGEQNIPGGNYIAVIQDFMMLFKS